MNKTFQVINRSKAKNAPSTLWVTVRQIPNVDRMYKLGNILHPYGRIIGIKVEESTRPVICQEDGAPLMYLD